MHLYILQIAHDYKIVVLVLKLCVSSIETADKGSERDCTCFGGLCPRRSCEWAGFTGTEPIFLKEEVRQGEGWEVFHKLLKISSARTHRQVLSTKFDVLLHFDETYQRLVGASPTEILDPFNGLSVEVQASSPTLLLELCLFRPSKYQEKTAENFHRVAKLGTSGSFHGFNILDPEGMHDLSVEAVANEALGLQRLKDKTEDIVQSKAVLEGISHDTNEGKIFWLDSDIFLHILRALPVFVKHSYRSVGKYACHKL